MEVASSAAPPPPPPPPFVAIPFESGSLTLSFDLNDVNHLSEIERSIEAKRSNGASSSSSTAPLSPPSFETLQKDARLIEEKVLDLKELLNSAGTEEEWLDVAQQHEYALYKGLVLTMAYIPLPPPSFHSLLQTLYILGTLYPSRLYKIILSHPRAFSKLLSSIFPELEEDELAARFRLIDAILVEGYNHEEKLELPSDELEDALTELMNCMALPSTSTFALAVANMLLLNTLDSKRTLHRLILATQAEVTATGSSSSISSPISNSTMSRFSQELITLVNSGRLPSTWVEEAESSQIYSGVDRERKSTVVDMYESTRTVVRGLPDRQTDCFALTSAALGFLAELFHSNTALDLLYTNDIQVLVEVLLRNLEEGSPHLPVLLDYLLCLSAILAWPEFQSNPFKLSEMKGVLQLIAREYTVDDDAPKNATKEEQDAIDTKIAIQQLAQVTLKKII